MQHSGPRSHGDEPSLLWLKLLRTSEQAATRASSGSFRNLPEVKVNTKHSGRIHKPLMLRALFKQGCTGSWSGNYGYFMLILTRPNTCDQFIQRWIMVMAKRASRVRKDLSSTKVITQTYSPSCSAWRRTSRVGMLRTAKSAITDSASPRGKELPTIDGVSLAHPPRCKYLFGRLQTCRHAWTKGCGIPVVFLRVAAQGALRRSQNTWPTQD